MFNAKFKAYLGGNTVETSHNIKNIKNQLIAPRSADYMELGGVSTFLTAGAMAKAFFMPGARTYILAIMACLFTVDVEVAWKQASCL